MNVEDAVKKTEDAYNFNVKRANVVDFVTEYRRLAKESLGTFAGKK